jgi:hypothetical protein
VRCIQVKAESARLSRAERLAIRQIRVPENVSRECWRFPDYARAPIVERL